MQDNICAALQAGATHQIACGAVGLAISTFYGWIARGEGHSKREKTKVHVDFVEAIKRAEAHGSLIKLQQIANAAKPQTETKTVKKYDKKGNLVEESTETRVVKGQWTAAAWLLERRHPDQYGRSLPREIDGDGNDQLVCNFNMPEQKEGVKSHEIERVTNVDLE